VTCIAPSVTEGDWVRAIADVAGWDGDVRVVPDDQLPAALGHPFEFRQHLELDTTAIRTELGFRELVDEAEGLRRTIDWELKTLDDVPDLRLDYSAEDDALSAHLG
jgi:nucleoside-diphosphate-sugar epimerase